MNQARWNELWADGEPRDPGPAETASGTSPQKTWKLRFDSAAAPLDSDSIADRDVLSFFRKQLRPDAADGERRASPRVPALERDAWLGWWEDDEFLIAPAELDNISRGGVRLWTSKPIRIDQPCWLCIGPPSPVVCVRSLVLAIARVRDGFDVRLVFTMPCPDQLYDIVVNGRRSD